MDSFRSICYGHQWAVSPWYKREKRDSRTTYGFAVDIPLVVDLSYSLYRILCKNPPRIEANGVWVLTRNRSLAERQFSLGGVSQPPRATSWGRLRSSSGRRRRRRWKNMDWNTAYPREWPWACSQQCVRSVFWTWLRSASDTCSPLPLASSDSCGNTRADCRQAHTAAPLCPSADRFILHRFKHPTQPLYIKIFLTEAKYRFTIFNQSVRDFSGLNDIGPKLVYC